MHIRCMMTKRVTKKWVDYCMMDMDMMTMKEIMVANLRQDEEK